MSILHRPQQVLVRRLLFQVHAWTGLVTALYAIFIGLTGAVLVFSRDGGLTARDETFLSGLPRRVSTQLAQQVVGATGTGSDPRLRDLLRSPDARAELVLVTLRAAPFSPQAADAVDAVRSLAATGAPEGLRVDVTGTAAVGRDETKTITDSFATVGIVSVLLVLTILLFVYRSIVAALVPLVTIGVAFAVVWAGTFVTGVFFLPHTAP